jgi:hypothetical protein
MVEAKTCWSLFYKTDFYICIFVGQNTSLVTQFTKPIEN